MMLSIDTTTGSAPIDRQSCSHPLGDVESTVVDDQRRALRVFVCPNSAGSLHRAPQGAEGLRQGYDWQATPVLVLDSRRGQRMAGDIELTFGEHWIQETTRSPRRIVTPGEIDQDIAAWG